jgi:hypothetical protein
MLQGTFSCMISTRYYQPLDRGNEREVQFSQLFMNVNIGLVASFSAPLLRLCSYRPETHLQPVFSVFQQIRRRKFEETIGSDGRVDIANGEICSNLWG